MDIYGLIGWPLGHSFSAQYFNEKFHHEGINAEYLNFEMPEVDTRLLRLIQSTPTLKGLNVTIPHKQAVIPLLDKISDEAKAIGAVNVISINNENGRYILKGYNSDVIGFTKSIKPLLKPSHRKALVLGTGGASRAIVYGLQLLGIEPTYVSRTAGLNKLTYNELTSAEILSHTVIINCSPVGMFPHTNERPKLPYEAITPEHILYDLVYNPLETKFLEMGKKYGATVKNGLEMLHIQAQESWRFWHGHTIHARQGDSY